MFQIAQETPDDGYEVEELYDTAFGPSRAGLSSYQLRARTQPVKQLCLVARDDYWVIVAAIRYWPIKIGRAGSRALLLGPIAVHPTRQGEGLGATLMRESLNRAAELGWERVALVGDAPYYTRFGFSRSFMRNVKFPPPTNPKRLLGKELRKGAFAGVSGRARPADD